MKSHSIIVLISGLVVLIHLSCNGPIKETKTFYPDGSLEKKEIYDEQSGALIVNRFAQNGRLLEHKELLNDKRNGRQFIFNPESNISIESFYVEGVRHGVYRVDVPDKKISFERLYLNGNKVRVKYIVSVHYKKDSINYRYNMLEIGDDGKPRFNRPLGIISLKEGRYVGILDLNDSVIDFDKSHFFFDNLPDTLKLDTKTNFELNLEHFLKTDKNEKYLYSELLFGKLNKKLELTDTLGVFRSEQKGERINCSISLEGNNGYQLITGKLRRFFLDETRDATFYTENIFYKQVYLDD